MSIGSAAMKVIAVAVFSLCASVASAGGNVVGTVISVVARASDGLVYVTVTGTPSGRPACATNNYWMIANEASEAGHKQYAMLLLAQATGAQVRISGMGTCTRWSDGEDIDWIQISSQ